MEIEEIFPDLLSLKKTQICMGIRHPEKGKAPAPGDMADGMRTDIDRCTIIYGDHSRSRILEFLQKPGRGWVHFSGGWGNPFRQEMITDFSLDGNVPLRERTVGDIIKARESGLCVPIAHDYLQAWRELLERAGIWNEEKFPNQKIGDLLELGPPTFWEICSFYDGHREVLSKSTSIPYEGQANDPGDILVFLDNDSGELQLSNATGSRGDGTFGLNCYLVALLHPEGEAARDFYISNAFHRAELLKSQGREVLYSEEDVQQLAEEFLQSAKMARTDVERICDGYDIWDVRAFQCALNFTIVKNLPRSVETMSRTLPHCYVKTAEGWELAVKR